MDKLDLGCGKRKKTGFTGVDISPFVGADVVCDLRVIPWPWPDESVSEAYSSHFLEHLTGEQRIAFMDELWRVLVPGGKALIITPYWSSWRAICDPTHQWPPVVEQSYLYFNAEWRRQNLTDHYQIRCDFDFTYQHVYSPEPEFASNEGRKQGATHYLNVVDDLRVLLAKRGKRTDG